MYMYYIYHIVFKVGYADIQKPGSDLRTCRKKFQLFRHRFFLTDIFAEKVVF